jgi:hypothetical protein
MQRFAPVLDAATLRDRAGDISVLRDASGNPLDWPTLRQAQIYSGKSARHIRRLIKDGVLEARGLKGKPARVYEKSARSIPAKKIIGHQRTQTDANGHTQS